MSRGWRRRRPPMAAADRRRVVHPITHLGVGGASENTVTTCRYTDPSRFESSILCGRPQPGEETLHGLAEQFGIPVHFTTSLQRDVHPTRDVRAYREMVAWLRRRPSDIIHTHTSKAGIVGRL